MILSIRGGMVSTKTACWCKVFEAAFNYTFREPNISAFAYDRVRNRVRLALDSVQGVLDGAFLGVTDAVDSNEEST